MKYKCIIFDFGRVLGNFDHMVTCEKLTNYSSFNSNEIYKKIFQSGIEKEFDEGDDFENFYSEVKKTIKAKNSFTPEIFEKIWGDIFSENEGIEKVLQELSNQSIPMFLLSNTNSVHWKYIKELPVIKKFFANPHQQILSFEIGKRKPNPVIFNAGIERSNFKPEEIIYIDDILEYINAFKKLGGGGILYNCEIDSIEKLQNQIQNY